MTSTQFLIEDVIYRLKLGIALAVYDLCVEYEISVSAVVYLRKLYLKT